MGNSNYVDFFFPDTNQFFNSLTPTGDAAIQFSSDICYPDPADEGLSHIKLPPLTRELSVGSPGMPFCPDAGFHNSSPGPITSSINSWNSEKNFP